MEKLAGLLETQGVNLQDDVSIMMPLNVVNVLGYSVCRDDKAAIYRSHPRIVNTINPHSYVVSLEDDSFSEALKLSDVLIPDGIGICMASSLLNGSSIAKLTGPDLMDYYLEESNKNSSKIFCLGSTDYVLDEIKNKIAGLYPNIDVMTFSPPFKESFTEYDNAVMVGYINNFKPDVLFVGMTAPKQEKWVSSNQKFINSQCIMSVGAAFDWFGGTKKRPSKFWELIHLGWFIRFLREPFRMRSRIYTAIKFTAIVASKRLFGN